MERENINQIEKETIEITNKNPELITDVNLFKLVLQPLELFILKSFLYKLRPLNVREVYTWAMFIIFRNTFKIDLIITFPNQPEKFECFNKSLKEEGYGRIFIKPEDREKVNSIFNENILYNSSFTEKVKKCSDIFKQYNIKNPSYKKLLRIFEKFETIGIISKGGKKGKILLYKLNHKFYNLFKDKIQEILEL